MTVTAVSDANFEEEVLQSKEPVLVDFFAEWCGPCKAMAPALHAVAEERQGNLKVVTIDIDRSPRITDEYAIRAMPTLILFKDGAPTARHTGALVQKKVLQHWINRSLAPPVEATASPISAYKLANGMNVVVLPDTAAPSVTHLLCYKVGGADDPVGSSGTAKLVEQLVFAAPAKNATDALPVAERDNQNTAFTTRDVTSFMHSILPNELRACMQLEADRMANLELSDAEVERERQALIGLEGQQEGSARLYEQMNAALFPSHPYGVPVLGRTKELSRLSREELLRFHRRHYVPSNAILVVGGDVKPDEVRRLAEEAYGRMPDGTANGVRDKLFEPMAPLTRRLRGEDADISKSNLQRLYNVPSYVTAQPKEVEALFLLTQILTAIENGQLRRKLVAETKTASGVYVSYSPLARGPGSLYVYAESGDGDLAALDTALDVALEEIRHDGVTQQELESARQALIKNYSDQASLSLVLRYASEVALGRTIAQIEGWPAALAEVTVEDVNRVAKVYLDPARSVTGWLVPQPAAPQLDEAV